MATVNDEVHTVRSGPGIADTADGADVVGFTAGRSEVTRTETGARLPWAWPVSWPAIIAGGFVGLAVLMLLSAFWAAIASDWDFAADNFQWFQMGSAFFGWLVAGFVTGWFADRSNGGVAGATHGFIVWSVLVVARTVISIPSATAPIGFALAVASGSPAWASFGAITGGLITAVIGGVLGAMMPRTSPARRERMHVDIRDQRDSRTTSAAASR